MLEDVILKYKRSGKINFEGALSAIIKYCDDCEEQAKDEIDKIFLHFLCVSKIKNLIIDKKENLLKFSLNNKPKIALAESLLKNEMVGNTPICFSNLFQAPMRIPLTLKEIKKYREENNEFKIDMACKELAKNDSEYVKRIKKFMYDEELFNTFFERARAYSRAVDEKSGYAFDILVKDISYLTDKLKGKKVEPPVIDLDVKNTKDKNEGNSTNLKDKKEENSSKDQSNNSNESKVDSKKEHKEVVPLSNEKDMGIFRRFSNNLLKLKGGAEVEKALNSATGRKILTLTNKSSHKGNGSKVSSKTKVMAVKKFLAQQTGLAGQKLESLTDKIMNHKTNKKMSSSKTSGNITKGNHVKKKTTNKKVASKKRTKQHLNKKK